MSGSVQAVHVENQKLGTIHSMCIDKEAWIREELSGSTAQDLDKEEVCIT